MVLLRPRLRCYYCGGRCHVKRNQEEQERRFKCEHCLAVNFLDENGEIADVPPEEVSDVRDIIGDTDSPSGSRFESSIFCPTCVKNQLYFNKTLSEYLPDLDHPDYMKYEAALPEFKKKLEDRYPQVCAACEPRVRQQLQQATYTAKSDHVRRMLAKSRQRRIANRLGWRSLIITIGGLGYWMSVAGQLLWHAMGALTSDRIPTDELQPILCLHELAIYQACPRGCAEYYGLLASHTLKLGILCIWWNPQWHHKLAGRDGRLTNLDTYYQIQAGIIVFRFALWAALQSTGVFAWLPAQFSPALHGIALVLIFMLTTWSNFAIITIDHTPLVDWTQEVGPLLSEGQFVPLPPTLQQQQLFSPPNTQSTTSQPQHFSIGSLAPASNQQHNAWRPPTPPTEDPDAMDWEPLSSQFTAHPRKPVVKHTQPSPFHGTLPALSPRGVHHARSAVQPTQREALGIPLGFFDSSSKNASQANQSLPPASFAEPTFFPPQDKDALGLEKIFDDVFKLRDDVAILPASGSVTSHQADTIPAMFKTTSSAAFYAQPVLPTKRWSAANILAAFALPFVCASLTVWLGEDFELYFDQSVKLYMCFFACSMSLGHLILKIISVQHSSEYFVLGRTVGKNFGTALSMVEVVILAILCAYRWQYGCESRGSQGHVDPYFFCGMFWQELYYFMVGGEAAADGPRLGQFAVEAEVGKDHQCQSVSPNPSEASTIQQTGFGRPRGNSLDSVASSNAISVTSATSTAAGWKTPKLDARRAPSIGGPSPGFGLGGLNLDDWSGGGGVGVAGPRSRTAKGRARGRY
jgi:hypothetical protein